MADVVQDSIQDVIARINALPEVKNKVLYVYTQEKLLDETQDLVFPAVGVIYSGMQNVGEQKQGRMQQLFVDVVLTMGDLCSATIGNADEKPAATALLDKIRNQMIAECSPAPRGHKWWFRFEIPAYLTRRFQTATGSREEQAKFLMYVQRWTTRVVVGIGAVNKI